MDYHLYRRFYGDLLDSEDKEELLGYWTTPVAELFASLESLKHRSAADPEDLYALYAVSRVSDLLLEGEHHTWFFTEAGLSPFTSPETFSPFHHEIVSVANVPTATEVTIKEVLWPGFRFGDLLFSRAGVSVEAPASLVDATAATTSTLYFTHRRANRPTSDLSHGWGSNSQWRTLFDRFYEDNEGLHLNWDAQNYIGHNLSADPSIDQRRELLLNRCLVRAPLPPDEDDLMPWADRLSIRRSTWPLDPADILPDPAGP